MHSSSLKPAALALALLASCSEPLDPEPLPPSTETAHGVARVTHYTGGASVVLPEDWSGATLSAYTVAASGELVALEIATKPDGSFEIPGIPQGSDYYVRIQRPGKAGELYRLSGRDIDLSRETSKRPELGAPAPMASLLSLTLDDMPAFRAGDGFRAYAPGVGVKYFSFLTNRPAQDDTRLRDATFDWAGTPLLRGEPLWVIHERSTQEEEDEDILGVYAGAAAELRNVQQTGGTTQALTGAFTGAPRLEVSYPLDITALRRGFGSGGYDILGFTVNASPDSPGGDGAEVLFWSYFPSTTRASSTHSLTYGDPFPASWLRTATTTYWRSRRGYSIDLEQSEFYAGDSLEVTAQQRAPFAEMPALDASEAAWVQDITLDGERLDRVRNPDGRPVRLAWDPAPGAAYYRVAVHAYPQGKGKYEQVVATLASTEAELVLPPDLLPAETRLAFVVTAVPAGALEPAPRIFRKPPGVLTSTTSDVLYTSTTCGNGALDAGEACDTGGPSATCDFDCTPVQCGDGVHNAAGGEACDIGTSDMGTCDRQCQPIRCGDGRVSSSEECDDGNLASGDGCNADCVSEL